VAGLGTDAKEAADDLRQIPEAAKLTVGTLDQTGSAAEQAAERIGVLQLQIAKLAQAQAALVQSGSSSGAEFQRLTAEIQRLEEELQRLKGGTDNNKGSQQQLGEQADRTSQGVQRFAQSLRDSSDAGRESVRTNSQVADSFGNIGNKSSETAISLGNLSEAFVRQALDAAGAAKSAKDYIDTLNRFFAAGADQEEKIKARLDQLSRQNAALSEEEQIRKRLALQYGTSSTLLDELVRREIDLARAKKQTNDETERSIQIEAQRTAGFGGVGTGQQAEATGGATGLRPGGATGRRPGGGGDRGAPQIVVSLVVIDSRYREKECADLARKMGSHLVKLSKGSAFKGNQLFTVKKLDRHPITGEVLKDGLIELGSNTNLLKGRLSHAIAKASDGDEGALQIYEDIDPTYIGEMTAEELVVVRDSGGRAIGERWEKREGRRANHYWDTEVLNFLAAAVLMIDQVRAQQLRERDRQAREASAPPGPPRRRRDDDDDDDDGPRLWHRQ
jgi:hypothetical protein